MKTSTEIGKLIKELRENEHKTQEELSNELNISRSSLSNIEILKGDFINIFSSLTLYLGCIEKGFYVGFRCYNILKWNGNWSVD